MNRYYFKGILAGVLAAGAVCAGGLWLGNWLGGILLGASLILGLGAFGNGAKKRAVFMVGEEVKRISRSGRAGIRQLNEHSVRTSNNVLRNRLKSISSTCDRIITEINKKPQRAFKTESFLDYYIPTVDKMMTKYEELERNRVRTDDALNYMNDVHILLEDVDRAFKSHLQSIIDSDKLEAAKELKVLEKVLREEEN
ncbi:MAG: 5-bromo-4-chloroindolyl phosphate hydrolysis family protein [Clostridia bacterium]|nr:5-bromo-4-chloroindolyl phosphate hydrolysis family protein [Clostridia bacterium]